MMKIVKLDRRHRATNDGFTYALRFSEFTASVCLVEQYLTNMYPRSMRRRNAGRWYSEFGYRIRGQSVSPFWIYFKKEEDITLVLLANPGGINDGKC